MCWGKGSHIILASVLRKDLGAGEGRSSIADKVPAVQTECSCPSNIHMLKPNHQWDSIWRRVIWGGEQAMRVGPPWMGLVLFYKRDHRKLALPSCHVRTRGQAAVCGAESRFSLESAGTLTLEIPASEL